MRPSTAPRRPVRTWPPRPLSAPMTRRGALGRADRALTALFGTSWRVAKIFGIDVRVDSSWVVIAVLITYSMYLRFSFMYKGLSTGAAVGISILSAVLFFDSLLLHSLTH